MKVNNLDNVLRYLDFDIDSDIEKVVNEVGSEVLNEAKTNVHVDSGALKSSLNMSIRKEENNAIASIGSDLAYAPFEEYGTGGGVFIVTNGANYTFTTEDKAYAIQFKRSGSGRVYKTAHPYLMPAGYNGYNKLAVKLAEMINSRIKQK